MFNKTRKSSKPRRKHAGRTGGDGKRPRGDGPLVNLPYAVTGGFPDRVRLRLKYISNVAMSTAVGTTQVWSGNGLFDPDITGTGGQPYSYDDFSANYNRYYCRSSTIKVWFVDTGAGVTSACQFLLVTPRHAITSVATTGVYDAMAAPYAKYKSVGSGGVATSNSYAITSSMSSAKMFGHKLLSYEGADEALVVNNPTHQWYWHTDIHAGDDSSSSSARLLVEITYDVDFFDRVDSTLDLAIKRRQTLREFRKLYLASKSKGVQLVLKELPGHDQPEAKTTQEITSHDLLVDPLEDEAYVKPLKFSFSPLARKEEKKEAPKTLTKSKL